MLNCQRKEFFLPDDITYLNCSYMSPLPRKVAAAGEKGLESKKYPYLVKPEDFFSRNEEVRNEFARLIGSGQPQRVVSIPSVSYAMANVAANVKTGKGDNIILLGEQFPSNYYCWERLAERSGCEIRIIKAPIETSRRGEKWNERILEAIDNQTKVVSMESVHWTDGTSFDLKAIRKRTKEVGAFFILDGTQSVGAMPINVDELKPDALICSGYKWLLGPYSIGLAWYGEAFDEGIPIEESWMNRLHSEDFSNLVIYQPKYRPGSNRFEIGEKTHFILIPMLLEALRLLQKWSPAEIQHYGESLNCELIGELKNQGCLIEDPPFRGHHMFGVRMSKTVDIQELKKSFDENKIYVSFRGNAVRVSNHLFNTPDDMDKLLGCFAKFL